jgi:hypothetical protein
MNARSVQPASKESSKMSAQTVEAGLNAGQFALSTTGMVIMTLPIILLRHHASTVRLTGLPMAHLQGQ